MPDLIAFNDVEEVDNRYIDKCVVYVEGNDDRNVWGNCSPDLGSRMTNS